MMRYLAVAILVCLLSVVAAPAVDLLRYTLTMPNGREFEYVFETDKQSVPETIDRDRAEEIAMERIMSFHGGPQIGSIESATLRQKPIQHWLVAVADTGEGPIKDTAVRGDSAKRRGHRAESGGADVAPRFLRQLQRAKLG